MFKLNQIGLLIVLFFAAVFAANAAGLTNPMRPPAGFNVSNTLVSQPHQAQVSWKLQSVLLGGMRSVAVIDGVPVTHGEI